MQTNKKALSPIVATILLVVVAVILVTITLSWGKGFTNKGLEGSNTILKETTNNYMIGSPKLNAQGVLSFKNISPGDKSITITGYKIISSSDDGNFNTILDIEDTTISPGGTHIISIPAFPPEQKVTIQLITDENEYISVGSITNIPEEQQDIPVEEGPEPQQYAVGPSSPVNVTVDVSGPQSALGYWYDINNIKIADSLSAYPEPIYDSGVLTYYLKATNFGFSIPPSATIDGITVIINRKGNSVPGYYCVDRNIYIIKANSFLGYQNKSKLDYWTGDFADYNYGGSSDLWGETWTAEDINDPDFGIAISVYNYNDGGGGPTITPLIDYVRIIVYYTN